MLNERQPSSCTPHHCTPHITTTPLTHTYPHSQCFNSPVLPLPQILLPNTALIVHPLLTKIIRYTRHQCQHTQQSPHRVFRKLVLPRLRHHPNRSRSHILTPVSWPRKTKSSDEKSGTMRLRNSSSTLMSYRHWEHRRDGPYIWRA